MVLGTALAVPTLFLGFVLSTVVLLGSTPAAADCGPRTSVIDASDLPDIAGYSAEQLGNAVAIVNTGRDLNLPLKGQIVSIMVALGESGLKVLDYGDAAGPDSRGLFQQRDNGAWGTLADRMDPSVSAANFIKALQEVDGWDRLEPTIAANRVQRNADPYHYQRYWQPAMELVSALADVKGAAGQDCAFPGQFRAGNDLPWKNSPTWLDVGTGNPASHSPLGMFNRECTDFALWRVNQQLGSTRAPFKVHNSTFRPDGQNLGSALTWKDGWQAKGWATGSTPRVGSVVWYGPGVGGADAKYGHVAVVKAVKEDGTFTEEGYNGNPAPEDHKYYTRTVQNNVPSAFLYLPGLEEKP